MKQNKFGYRNNLNLDDPVFEKLKPPLTFNLVELAIMKLYRH